MKEEIKGKLAGLIKPSLKYASTERDRQILKLLLYKAASAKFMREGNIDNIKFNKSSLLSGSICQYNLQSREKGELLDVRLKGSGRKQFCIEYPELTSVLLSLFDGTGEGLRSHHRLICDTLFIEPKWMDMPRAVSILQQLYGIPIKLSTAYTYTKNFKANT